MGKKLSEHTLKRINPSQLVAVMIELEELDDLLDADKELRNEPELEQYVEGNQEEIKGQKAVIVRLAKRVASHEWVGYEKLRDRVNKLKAEIENDYS